MGAATPRRGDSHGARSPSSHVVIGPRTGTGTRPGRKSSRSTGHAPHVVRGDAADGEDATVESSATAFSTPLGESLGRVRRTEFARQESASAEHPREKWISVRGWKESRGVDHLVHRIHAQLWRIRFRSTGMAFHDDRGIVEVLSRSLLHGASLHPLSSALVGGVGGTPSTRRSHRFRATVKRKGAVARATTAGAVRVTGSCPDQSCLRASRTPRVPLKSALR